MTHVYDFDHLIIGAGPAGLQLGYHLQRAGRRYAILEKADAVGSFFGRYPRSRGLISFNKVHSIYTDPEINLRLDWNSLLTDDYSHTFAEFSRDFYPHADDMVRYLESFHRTHDIQVRFNTTVERIQRHGDGYRVTDHTGRSQTTRCLVVATGMGRPHVPDIPGIELAEGYEDASFEADDYINQRVLILGKGNSGFELAERILPTAAIIHIASPQPIRMAWKTRHPGHLRAQYTSILDAYQLKTLHSALDCDIVCIRETEDGRFVATVRYTHADGEVDEIVYDRVIRATGFAFDGSVFDPVADQRR
jgi:cation diffusion facilitator CzcD-associated flavoprotein CzcO